MSNKLHDLLGSGLADPRTYFSGIVAGFSITASLVADQFGEVVNSAGNSKGLGNEADLQLLLALRRQSDVVLTSGKTFLAEEYKMPSGPDLAIFSRGEPKTDRLTLRSDQKLHILRESMTTDGFPDAIEQLKDLGYKKLHCEFGKTGTASLAANNCLDALFLSSKFSSGIDLLAKELRVEPSIRLEFDGLSVAIVAWQRGN